MPSVTYNLRNLINSPRRSNRQPKPSTQWRLLLTSNFNLLTSPMSSADRYYTAATDLLDRAREINAPVIAAAAPKIAQSIADGGVLHTFGSGHSEMIAREIIGRAGGLMPVTGLFDPGYGFSENVVGYGTRLAQRHDHHYGMKAGETIIVIS